MKARNYKIPIIYIVLGVLWITLSDSLLRSIESTLGPETAEYTASLKGIFYVLATGFLLYFLIKQERKRLTQGDNKRMAEIVDKMNNLIIISDISGKITWVNRAFVNITGYTMQEALGKTHGELLYGPKTDLEVVKTLSQAIKNKEFFSGELVNYAKGGREYWSQFNLSPMFNAKGGLEGYISVENNIDDNKRKEDVIVQQHQKLKAVSWLNSHEIRKPVASIMALTELILEESDQEELKELVRYLHQSTMALDLIIHQINEEAAVK
ncbi:PAS domain-containing protein [Pedobacter steynii]|uniref:PAS domain-containing protein n=1 Tax=Pedobacter steynii TaxID=430522 RepID=UPI0012F733CE|nr:PAS domain-containing protein [Pedobacter steynii]